MTQPTTPPKSVSWSDLVSALTNKHDQPIFTINDSPPLTGQAFWQSLQTKNENTATEEELSFEQELAMLQQLG
jgi:hypothetical protein